LPREEPLGVDHHVQITAAGQASKVLMFHLLSSLVQIIMKIFRLFPNKCEFTGAELDDPANQKS
jgi:hypothetical protein